MARVESRPPEYKAIVVVCLIKETYNDVRWRPCSAARRLRDPDRLLAVFPLARLRVATLVIETRQVHRGQRLDDAILLGVPEGMHGATGHPVARLVIARIADTVIDIDLALHGLDYG